MPPAPRWRILGRCSTSSLSLGDSLSLSRTPALRLFYVLSRAPQEFRLHRGVCLAGEVERFFKVDALMRLKVMLLSVLPPPSIPFCFAVVAGWALPSPPLPQSCTVARSCNFMPQLTVLPTTHSPGLSPAHIRIAFGRVPPVNLPPLSRLQALWHQAYFPCPLLGLCSG